MTKLFDALYSKKVIAHVRNPKNMGEMENPDGVATVGNPVCGDVMRLYIKVDSQKDTIKDIKFQTLGCGAAIATSSIITTMAKGKTLEEAEKITDEGLAEALGGLPKVKMHCSVLAAEGLKKAIKDYRSKNQ